MKKFSLLVAIVLSAILFSGLNTTENKWIKEKHGSYSLYFTACDIKNTAEYQKQIENGIASVKSFFNSVYSHEFDVYIHPSRHSLDSTWQKEWKMPEFKSECWMVASGIASRLDMISPVKWDKESCEHKYSETVQTRQLITHELVHVYHGQVNTSPDFSNTEGIDWFVEGLATYASGQLNPEKIGEVKKAINEKTVPVSLDNFWTGKLRYSLSGSVVMFIDRKYGRAKLIELLPLNKKTEILSILSTTEHEFMQGWKNYMLKL